MFIIKSTDWSRKHTPTTRYFFERLLQRLDPVEIISNKHRTTNGYVLAEEIVSVCQSTLKRYKNATRVVSLLEESVCKELSTSIVNDPVIEKNFPHIADSLISKSKESKGESDDKVKQYVNELYLKSQSFVIALEKKYLKYLKEEFSKLDYSGNQFNRKTDYLDRLIDCLIPYLLHKGYSTSIIRRHGKKFISEETLDPVGDFLKLFDFTSNPFQFLLVLPESVNIDSYSEQVHQQYVEYKKLEERPTDEILALDYGESICVQWGTGSFYKFIIEGIDEYSIIREVFVASLKRHIIKKDRPTLSQFNDFFNSVYYLNSSGKYKNPNFSLDPINVKERPNTLLRTLKVFYGLEELPVVEELAQSVYYYNLALGSKSLENSLLLIWSALEALIPYNYSSADLPNIQIFVSKFLSTGAVGRRLYSFVDRFSKTKEIDDSLKNIETLGFGDGQSAVSLHNWFVWLTKNFNEDNDPYEILESYPLLCKEFTNINETWGEKEIDGVIQSGKMEIFHNRIKASEISIKFQLARIYHHRNKIAHSAVFLNEYSNMWSHLEWYVGKILAYCVKEYLDTGGKSVKQAFLTLEAECDEIKSYIQANKDVPIKTLEKEKFLELFNQTWQYF